MNQLTGMFRLEIEAACVPLGTSETATKSGTVLVNNLLGIYIYISFFWRGIVKNIVG